MDNEVLAPGRRWASYLIFYILLFTPSFYFWADNINLKDKCMAWVTCLVTGYALSSIDLFLKKKAEKVYLWTLFLLSIVPNLIVWSYLYMSHLCMKRDMFWVIFTSHASESKEFFTDFITWQMVAVGIAYISIGTLLAIKAGSRHSISCRKYWGMLVSSIAVVLIVITLQYLVQAIPMFDFYKSRVLYWKENLVFQQEREHRKSLKMDVKCTLPDSTNHVFVVILGESTSRCHMSLYGYPRETTPLMDARKADLNIYTDVITPDTHTFGVMQKVLTFASHEHPEYFKQKPSMVEMFNAAGFETYWISNKAFLTKWGGSYGIIAQESKHLFDLSMSEKTDEAVLPVLKKVLNDTIRKNKVIFIHLMGNHHAYNCRYPKGYEYFDHNKRADLPDAGFRNDDMKTTIDEYDNSIRYGDFVYDSILEQIEALQTSSYLLFFSDHGEEVFDTRDARGHFMSYVYPCQSQIPFVLWRSEAYKKEIPGIIIDTSRPYSIEDVIYSLSTLSGFEYEGNDQTKSIFSPEYTKPAIRLVGEENYEDILKKVAPAPL